MIIKIEKKYFVLLAIACILIFFFKWRGKEPNLQESVKEVHAVYGSIRKIITTTGEVEPQNRLEIKPPIDGRIEKILVKEGQKVKAGDILALMSSTKRAALLDAARLKDEKRRKRRAF